LALTETLDVRIIANALDRTRDNRADAIVVKAVKLSAHRAAKVIDGFPGFSTKQRRAFFQIFLLDDVVDFIAPVIDKAGKIEAIKLVKKVERPRVGAAKLEPGRGSIAEGRNVAQPVVAVDIFGGAPDDRLCPRTLEAALVRGLDLFDETVCKIISRRKIGSVSPTEEGSNPL
jgi:PII-like signaling protein